MKNLKSKILILFTVFTLLVSCVTVFAADSNIDAEIYPQTNIVNVVGQVQNGSIDTVTLLLLDSNNKVAHIDEAIPAKDGSYRVKFEFNGTSTEGYTLKVNQNGADAAQTVTLATIQENPLKVTMHVSKNAGINATINLQNYFNISDKTYMLIVAQYNKDGKFLTVGFTETKAIDIDETNDLLNVDVHRDAETIKVYAWDSFKNVTPLSVEKTTSAKEINILAIGNSFTEDPTEYLSAIALADGVRLNITRLIKGGCDLETHWDAWENDKSIYYGSGNKITDVIDDKDYDYIIFQQVSHLSYVQDSYSPYAENMVKYLREKQPSAEIVIQAVWSYEKGKVSNPATVTTNIVNTVDYWSAELAKLKTDSGLPISLNGEPLRVIPTGTAAQNAREADTMFDTTWVEGNIAETSLHRDGCHLSYGYGRYLAALTWYGCLTGNDVTENAYSNDAYPISDEAKTIIKSVVKAAIEANGAW